MEKSAYQVPSWAATAPPDGYSLEILKEGTIIEKVQLDKKTHYILGRMGGSVDILMEHVSISRQHCCLQFRDDGILMALDLGSAQGSFLNKTKLQKDVYQRVNVGDILRFGASTRMYIVNGPAEQMPSEYDSENMKAYREKLVQHSAKIEAKKLEVSTAGASWGFDDDAENPQSDEEEEAEELPDYVKNDDNYDRKHGKKYSAGLADDTSDKKVKDAAILEKIRTKERKIQNMQEEIRRIYLKESSQPDGLTDGQSAAVGRNDKKIGELKESIEELLDQLKAKAAHREGKPLNGLERKDKKDNVGDGDEMRDTTCQTADINTNWRLKKKLAKQGDGMRDIKSLSKSQSGGPSGEALTYEDLRHQKEEQLAVVNTAHARIKELEQVVTSVSDYLKSISEAKEDSRGKYNGDEDAVENFVLEARAKEASSSLKILRIEEATASAKLRSLEKLLKIATPALQSLVSNSSKKIDVPVASSSSSNPNSTDQIQSSVVGEKSDKSFGPENQIEINTKFGRKDSIDDTKTSSEISMLTSPERMNKEINDKKESKKRARIEEAAQMQSLSSFMKFAEAEKKKVELEEKLKELKELNGDNEDEINDEKNVPETGASSKKVRSTNEFTSNSFEIGKNDAGIDGNKGVKKKCPGAIGPKGPPVSTDSTDNNMISEKTKPKMKPVLPVCAAAVLEGGEAVWIPPKGQTGDGRTALNARLGY